MSTPAPFAAHECELTAKTLSALSDVTVTPPTGAAFIGMMTIATTDSFGDTTKGEDYQLRYALGDAELLRGDTVLIHGSPLVPDGCALWVTEKPRAILNGLEAIASLARVAPKARP